jgi:teichuronic acid biosynthesis glycosyltransferase TuaC
LKVLVLSDLFPNPGEPYSGIFVSEQLKCLRELGLTLLPVCPTPWAPRVLSFVPRVRECSTMPANADYDGFRVLYPRVLAPGGRFYAAYGWLFYLALSRLIGRMAREHGIDLIHAHQVMPCGFAAILLQRELKMPVVITMHGSDVRDYPDFYPFAKPVTRWTLRHALHLIAVSHEVAEHATRLEPRSGTTHVIHNGADESLFTPRDKSDARRQLNIPINSKIVLFVGSLLQIKAVDVLLKAVAKVNSTESRQAYLYLVGRGAQRSDLEALAARLGITQFVRFVGVQPYRAIPLWLSSADCLALPSRGEGLPTILPESMLCRVPIVASAVGGIPEIIRDRQTGLLVQPDDEFALADALNNVLFGNPREAAARADRAARYAGAHLTWQANARQTVAVYREALNHRITVRTSRLDHEAEQPAKLST